MVTLREQVEQLEAQTEELRVMGAGLRENLDCAHANLRSTAGQVCGHRSEIARLEGVVAGGDIRVAALEAEVAELRAHPLVVPRQREKLPDTRRALCLKVRVNSTATIQRCETCGQPSLNSPKVISFHLHLGFYDDGRLGEAFIRLDRDRRQDSSSSFADAWATAFSYALQHGLPAAWMLEKARHVHDDSAGVPYVWSEERQAYVPHPVLHHVTSSMDYVAFLISRVLEGKPAAKAVRGELEQVP